MDAIIERLDEVEEDLCTRAFLYENPVAYREGVESAFEAVRATIARAYAAA